MAKAPRNTLDDVDLMQYLDGEAEGQDAVAVMAALPGDEAARAKLLAMEQVGEVVRSSLELAADEAAPRLDAMWAAIERGIQANGVHERAPAREVAAAAAPARAQGGGMWAAFVEWLDTYRGHLATGALTATAVAVLVLALRPVPEVVRERVIERPVAVGTEPMPATPERPLSGSERMVPVSTPPMVEHLAVTEGSGSVFTIPGEDAEDVATTVIWLDLDGSDVEETL